MVHIRSQKVTVLMWTPFSIESIYDICKWKVIYVKFDIIMLLSSSRTFIPIQPFPNPSLDIYGLISTAFPG